jgi:hypothetical protein
MEDYSLRKLQQCPLSKWSVRGKASTFGCRISSIVKTQQGISNIKFCCQSVCVFRYSYPCIPLNVLISSHCIPEIRDKWEKVVLIKLINNRCKLLQSFHHVPQSPKIRIFLLQNWQLNNRSHLFSLRYSKWSHGEQSFIISTLFISLFEGDDD